MATPVRVGVVGAGFAAAFHLRCYRQVQGVPEPASWLMVAGAGLALLGGVMLLGGVIGYRQARAGYQLRTARVGRFLQ